MAAYRTPTYRWGENQDKAMVFWIDGPVDNSGHRHSDEKDRLKSDDPCWTDGCGEPVRVDVGLKASIGFSFLGYMTKDQKFIPVSEVV